MCSARISSMNRSNLLRSHTTTPTHFHSSRIPSLRESTPGCSRRMAESGPGPESSRANVSSLCSCSKPASAMNGNRRTLTPPFAALDANRAFDNALGRGLDTPAPGFDSIPDALADIADGKFVVVLDDENRENEGDLIIAGDKVTTEAIAFMVEYTSGVICVGMRGEELDRLNIPLMVESSDNKEAMCTAFTVTVDLQEGITTGISAGDRAKTIRALAEPSSVESDFRKPGHTFPLRCRNGGVIVRPGHTEASVDLSRLAGCFPAGVLCEIVNKEDGSMARTPDLIKFAKEHGLKCITIADLVKYRLNHDCLVEKTGQGVFPSNHGQFNVVCYKSLFDGSEHIALVCGDVTTPSPVLVRVHTESILADSFQLQRCGEEAQLNLAMQEIGREGRGVVIYIRGQDKKGGDLKQELADLLNTGGGDAGDGCDLDEAGFPVDLRDHAVSAHILRDLGIDSVNLLTGTGSNASILENFGVNVASCRMLNSLDMESGQNGHGPVVLNGSSMLHGVSDFR